ncbi:MAG: hypothetical protein JW726_00090 [Anaerolineales bacterium]|nr:hypothetical protein [Anaerolineales bacterium]
MDALARYGLREWVAALLEAAGPLNVLVAQVIYLGQPLLSPIVPADSLQALATVLEEPSQTQDFIHYLRETAYRGTGA